MDEIDTWEKFSAWMKENLAVERAIRTPCSGLYFGQVIMPLDNDYSYDS